MIYHRVSRSDVSRSNWTTEIVNCTHLERQVRQCSREVKSFHRVPVVQVLPHKYGHFHRNYDKSNVVTIKRVLRMHFAMAQRDYEITYMLIS